MDFGCYGREIQGYKQEETVCGALKENGPKGSDTIRKCGLVRVGVISLEEVCRGGSGL